MSQIIYQDDEELKVQQEQQPEPQEQTSPKLKAHPDDLFEYRERESSVKQRELPYSALIPPEYYENRRKEEEEKLKLRKKKETGRMKAAAIADTLRLIGHGMGIDKGAHETPWGKNEQIETGIRNLDRYTAEHAAALDKLRDLETRQKENDRNFNYRVGRDGLADEERARALDDADQKYIDGLRRQGESLEYQRERQRKLDDALAEDRAENRRIQRERIYGPRVGGRGQIPDANKVQASDNEAGIEYLFNIEHPNDSEAISVMAREFMQSAAGKDYLKRWEAQNSPEWKALSNMLNPNRKWTRDGINALMPYIFNPEIAEQYQIYSQQNDARRNPEKPPQDDTPRWVRNLAGVQGMPTARGRETSPYTPPSPSQQVMQKAEELKRQKEKAAQPAVPQTGAIGYDDVVRLPRLEKTRLIRHKEWATLNETERTQKLLARVEQLTAWNGNKYQSNIQQNKEALARDIVTFYKYNDQEAFVFLERAAEMQNTTPEEIALRLVNRLINDNIHPNSLINNN